MILEGLQIDIFNRNYSIEDSLMPISHFLEIGMNNNNIICFSSQPPEKGPPSAVMRTPGPTPNTHSDVIDHRTTSINADSPVQPYFSGNMINENETATTDVSKSDVTTFAHSESEATLRDSGEEPVLERKDTLTEIEQKTSELQDFS